MVATRRAKAQNPQEEPSEVVEVQVETGEDAAPEVEEEVQAAVPLETVVEAAAATEAVLGGESTNADRQSSLEVQVDETEQPPAVTAVQETDAAIANAEGAIKEAMEGAIEVARAAAEATGQPAVATTSVEIPTPTEVQPQEAAGEEPKAEEATTEEANTEEAKAEEPKAVEPKPASNGIKHQYRLFVGCVPHNFSEEDLKAYFLEVGPVKEVTILRDHMTGQSRGCAFAVYDDKELADSAISRLDKKFTLPGASQPLEVRYARESNKVQPSSDPNDKNHLFYARAPPGATESEIKAVFAEFGEITEFALFMHKPAGVSKGCGFVYYKERSQAQAAIDNLHDKKVMQGGFSPLTVKWADPNLAEKKRRAAEEAADPNRENTQVFFARIPKTISEESISEVFATVGPVKNVVLFKTHAAATVNKGCGIVTMQNHEDAVRVLDQLDNTHTFPGMDVAMVLKWVDQDLQKRRKMDHDVRGPPGSFGGNQWQSPPSFRGAQGGGGYGGGGGFGGGGFGGGGNNPGDDDRPPQGCDRDAFKLYFSGLPRTWELQDLRKVTESYGQIIDMNLVRDKVTKEPKGVAFMWYKNRHQAENAIRELHNQTFDDNLGGRRTISVSRARPRRPMMTAGAPPPNQGYGRSPGGFQGGGYGGGRPPTQAPYQQPAPYYQQQPAYNQYAPQQQVAPPAYPPQGGYQQQQPPPAYSYQQPQAQAPAYQAPPPTAGYQQPYNPPTAPAGGYGAPPVAAPAPAYGAAPGYDPAPQQQQPNAYAAASQYSSGATQQTPGGYNYAAPAAAPQVEYAAPAQAQPPSAGQYSYSAPPQGYAAPEGYNYGVPGS